MNKICVSYFYNQFKPTCFVITILIIAFTFFKTNNANAQTITDSVMVITDTSITTPNNIVVTDSSGATTLFAGGQQSDYEGKVGVGTNQPVSKLSVYDDKDASFKLSQPVKLSTTNSQARGGVSTADGTTIENFDIDFLIEPQVDGLIREGAIILGTTSGGTPPLNTHNFAPPSSMANILNSTNLTPFVKDPCSYINSSPSMMFDASSFSWFVPTCPPTSDSMRMSLDNMGNLFVSNDGFFGHKLHVSEGINIYNHNNTFSAAITNYSSSGKGLIIQGGNGVNAPNEYALLEVKDLSGYSIFKVNGKDRFLYARDIKVTQNNFPDYVFNKNYSLMSLDRLEKFINENHRLPEMPSADEVQKNELSVSETTTLLTKKIEELTLYIIELKKENMKIKQVLKDFKR